VIRIVRTPSVSYHNYDRLETLERRRLIFFGYKILHGLFLPVEFSDRSNRDNNLKLVKHFCYIDIRTYLFKFVRGTVYLMILLCRHLSVFKKRLRNCKFR